MDPYSGRVGEIRWSYNKRGKDIYHGPLIRYSQLTNTLVEVLGFVHGRSVPLNFRFNNLGNLSTASLHASDKVKYFFTFDEKGNEISQLIVVNDKAEEGVLHNLFVGLNGVKWSRLEFYHDGRLTNSVDCDINGHIKPEPEERITNCSSLSETALRAPPES